MFRWRPRGFGQWRIWGGSDADNNCSFEVQRFLISDSFSCYFIYSNVIPSLLPAFLMIALTFHENALFCLFKFPWSQLLDVWFSIPWTFLCFFRKLWKAGTFFFTYKPAMDLTGNTFVLLNNIFCMPSVVGNSNILTRGYLKTNRQLNK